MAFLVDPTETGLCTISRTTARWAQALEAAGLSE